MSTTLMPSVVTVTESSVVTVTESPAVDVPSQTTALTTSLLVPATISAPSDQASGSLTFPPDGDPAYKGFIATIDYEAEGTEPTSTNETVTNWISIGEQTCEEYVANPGIYGPDWAAQISNRTGYNGEVSDALVAAALRKLCPQLHTDYRTAFDARIDLAVTAITRDIGATPDVYDTGIFATDVCAYFTGSDPGGLMSFFQQHPQTLPQPADGRKITWDLNSKVFRTIVVSAAGADCAAVQVPGYWLS